MIISEGGIMAGDLSPAYFITIFIAILEGTTAINAGNIEINNANR